jgi:CubicO group peptidase (beta-lactamase class C family)
MVMRIVALLVLFAMAAFGDPRVDKRVRKAMKQMIQQQEVPGAVTAVVTREGVTHLASVGHAEVGRKRKLREDSIFWIASMTKPIIGVSILMLEDAGKLSIEDKLGKYVPEFADSPVTLRHMLTHTSGMAEATPEELAQAKTLADLVPIYAR